MFLHQISRESKIILEGCSDGSSFCIFKRLDGLYSYCITENDNVIHLSAVTPLKEVSEGVYEIDFIKRNYET
jgi:hypothetical protein